MAYRTTEEWVEAEKKRIAEATAERKARADAECEKIKQKYGYDGLSDDQKKDFDEKLQTVHDNIMGVYRPKEKKESTEEDSHDEREHER